MFMYEYNIKIDCRSMSKINSFLKIIVAPIDWWWWGPKTP